jgi:hypothetical protein
MDEVSGFRLALYGALLVGAGWASWWAKIKALTVPRNAIVYQCIMGLGVALALWGMILGAGAIGGLLAFCSVIAGGMYLYTSFISTLPTAPAAVAVGRRGVLTVLATWTAVSVEVLPWPLVTVLCR